MLLRTLLMESWDLTEKDHTELSIPKGEVHTTWKPWMDESWNTVECGALEEVLPMKKTC